MIENAQNLQFLSCKQPQYHSSMVFMIVYINICSLLDWLLIWTFLQESSRGLSFGWLYWILIAAQVVVIQVVFAFAQGRQWYTIDGFECRPTSRGLSVLQQVVIYSQLAKAELQQLPAHLGLFCHLSHCWWLLKYQPSHPLQGWAVAKNMLYRLLIVITLLAGGLVIFLNHVSVLSKLFGMSRS